MIPKIRQLDELVMEISKDLLLDSILNRNNIPQICSKLNISKYEYSKLIDFYQINEFKFRSDAQKRETINQYFDIVDVLGKHPSAVEIQSNSRWQGVYFKIRKIWGGLEGFRLEFEIEGPTRKIVLTREKKSIKADLAKIKKIAEKKNSIALKIYLNEISKLKNLSIIKENILLEQIKTGSTKARNKLIKGELINVVRIAQNCLIQGVEIDDLIQEGNIGLFVCIDKFFLKYHKNFKSYSSLWIYQKINRYLMEYLSIIKMPVHIAENIFFLKKYLKDNFISEINNKNIIYISKNTGFSVELIRTIVNLPKRIPLKKFEKYENNITNYVDLGFNLIIQNNLKENIDLSLQCLDERERKVIKLRYGFESDKEHTLEEVGKIFGVTRERIRQIEAKALRKLRIPSRRKKLIDFCY